MGENLEEIIDGGIDGKIDPCTWVQLGMRYSREGQSVMRGRKNNGVCYKVAGSI